MKIPNGFNGDAQMIRDALKPVVPKKIVGRKPKGTLTVLVRAHQLEHQNGSGEPEIINVPSETFSGKRGTIVKQVGVWKQSIGLAT